MTSINKLVAVACGLILLAVLGRLDVSLACTAADALRLAGYAAPAALVAFLLAEVSESWPRWRSVFLLVFRLSRTVLLLGSLVFFACAFHGVQSIPHAALALGGALVVHQILPPWHLLNASARVPDTQFI